MRPPHNDVDGIPAAQPEFRSHRRVLKVAWRTRPFRIRHIAGLQTLDLEGEDAVGVGNTRRDDRVVALGLAQNWTKP